MVASGSKVTFRQPQCEIQEVSWQDIQDILDHLVETRQIGRCIKF